MENKIDLNNFIGLTEKKARILAEKCNYKCVLSKKDGVIYYCTSDLDFNRIRLTVDNDVVISVTNG